MEFPSLEEWLIWQESLHPSTIDLGLERPGEVLRTMGMERPDYTVITVAGTNGKGSSVAMLDAILRAAGYRVGCYTSPHLLRYNERIRINGEMVTDEVLCEAFGRVDQARGDISLTYFEFGTLAAFDIFSRNSLDVAVLEIGMGGRLDAVNLLDCDCALVTAIDIDHSDWLGKERESIAREKAGIFRPGRPAVCSDPDLPQSLQEHAHQTGAPLYRIGHEFGYRMKEPGWEWWGKDLPDHMLPLPALRGRYQLQNAAGVVMVLALLEQRLPLTRQHIRQGLLSVNLSGRFQVIPGDMTCILDVAHNPQAAGELARNLSAMPVSGKTHMVLAMLADKDIEAVIAELSTQADAWYLAELDVPRAAASVRLLQIIDREGGGPTAVFSDVQQALDSALQVAQPGDRVVVTGSFYTVGAALAALAGDA